MGLATIDPHSQKEHFEIPKIPKFGVNQVVLTEIQAFPSRPQRPRSFSRPLGTRMQAFKNVRKLQTNVYGNADKSGLLQAHHRGMCMAFISCQYQSPFFFMVFLTVDWPMLNIIR